MPSRPDLSFAGLDDSVYKTKVSKTETSISKTSKDIVEKPKTVRPSAPIIEDWDTDSDNDSVFRPKSDQTKPKFTKISFCISDVNATQDQGIFDSGCSRHMTRNKFYLTDYQDIDGGFVAFGGSPKGEEQTNKNAGIKDVVADDAGKKTRQEKAYDHEYILLPFMPSNSPLNSSTQSSNDKDTDEVSGKGDEGVSKGSGIDDQERTDSSTQDVNTAGPSINSANTNINIGSLNINTVSFNDPSMPSLEETGIFDDVYDDREVGAEADKNNLELSTVVSRIPTTRVHKDHPKEQIIRDLNLATQTRRMIIFSEENAMVSYINKQRRTNHKDYQNCLFACFLSQIEPKKVIQALADPSWVEAMQEELLQFRLQKVWALVDLPNGKRAIRTKWVFRNKKDDRGIVVRNKQDWLHKMDVKSAFLYGTIKEEVYVCQPPGFEDPQFLNKVYKVEKALYGLHQAPKAWYETLSTYLLENRFRRGIIDKTLFIKKDKGDILIVQVYVDDIIFGYIKKSLCTEFEGLMHKKFQMSSMGELTLFLGLQVMQRDDGIFISQDKYVADILKNKF
ncbi:putative ribonuclease H-like domain-containing protein [Tanacetum coccineum]